MRRFFHLLATRKVTLLLLLASAAAVAGGIGLDWLFDRATAQYYVYHSILFHCLLDLLGISILVAMMERIPWKRGDIPLLLAQIGILVVLTGSFMTEQFGVDGRMTLNEREISNRAELGYGGLLVLHSPNPPASLQVPIPWIPPWGHFREIQLRASGFPADLTVDRYLTHADVHPTYLPSPKTSQGSALKLRLVGGFTPISQEFWLYSGDPDTQKLDLGQAEFVLGFFSNALGKPSFSVIPNGEGGLTYIAKSSDGEILRGRLSAKEIRGKVVDPGWKSGIKLALLDYLPRAEATMSYEPSGIERGEGAPPSAIHVSAGDTATGTWLALGTQAKISVGGRLLELAYLPRSWRLPFALRLDRIAIPHFHGSHGPDYSSQVTVVDPIRPKREVMTLGQSFFESGYAVRLTSFGGTKAWPTRSTFTVSCDPGKTLTYFGALLALVGMILVFATRYRRKRMSP